MVTIEGDRQEVISIIYSTLMAHNVSDNVETLITISEEILSDLLITLIRRHRGIEVTL